MEERGEERRGRAAEVKKAHTFVHIMMPAKIEVGEKRGERFPQTVLCKTSQERLETVF